MGGPNRRELSVRLRRRVLTVSENFWCGGAPPRGPICFLRPASVKIVPRGPDAAVTRPDATKRRSSSCTPERDLPSASANRVMADQ